MAFPSTSPDASPHQRGPSDGVKPAGGDLSIFFIARVPPLTRFGSPEDQQIKGLNFETIASVNFPTPAWLHDPGYAALQPKENDENVSSAPFSLNLSMYDQAVSDPSNWNDQCFFLYGTVHPYALTWEIGPNNDSEAADEPQNYTIPSLIVRDQCYQPICPRMFSTADCFPNISPIVAFTGPIIGSGLKLLRKNPESGLSDRQQKCCGFVQLSTFINPGDPSKPPFRGSHQFQVFVIFPIHVNPWMMRCKKMADRPNTQFQVNTTISCTGRVVGLLNHDMMLHPPQLSQDYVFIVVPDSWSFHENQGRSNTSMSLPRTPSAKQSSSDPRSNFLSPAKRKFDQGPEPPTPGTSSTGDRLAAALSSQMSDTPYTEEMSPPPKRSRIQSTRTTVTDTGSSSPNTLDEQLHSAPLENQQTTMTVRNDHDDTSTPSSPDHHSTINLHRSTRSNSPIQSTDEPTRPHRTRHPTKKVLNID